MQLIHFILIPNRKSFKNQEITGKMPIQYNFASADAQIAKDKRQ